MDYREQLDYREPRIRDYGTLGQLTGDAAPLLMRQLGVGAAQVTAPAAPGGGGFGGGGGPGGGDVAGDVAVPAETPGVQGEVIGDQVEAPAGEEGAAPGEPGVAGETAERGGGEQVAGPSELPFTGLDAAATAAVGAATTAAGVALRKAVSDEAR